MKYYSCPYLRYERAVVFPSFLSPCSVFLLSASPNLSLQLWPLISFWQDFFIPFTSCAFFFAGSPHPANEYPVVRSHFASPRLLEFPPPAFRRSPPSLFIRVLARVIRLLTKCFFSLKTRDIQYSARAEQSASGSAVRFNYLAASQVDDAGWFIYTSRATCAVPLVKLRARSSVFGYLFFTLSFCLRPPGQKPWQNIHRDRDNSDR